MTHQLDYSPFAEESKLARVIKSTISWILIALNCISIALSAAWFFANFHDYLRRHGLFWLGITWRGGTVLILIVQGIISFLPTLLVLIPGLTSTRLRRIVVLLFGIGIAITLLNFLCILVLNLPEPGRMGADVG